MATKLPHYIAPCMPPLAILMARELLHRLESPDRVPRVIYGGMGLLALAGLAIVVAGFASQFVFEEFAGWALVVPGLIALLGGAAALWEGLRRDNLGLACWICGIATALAFTAAMFFSMPRLAPVQVLTAAALHATDRARALDGTVDPGDLFTFAYFEPSLFFYTGGEMETGREEELAKRLAALKPGRPLFVLCREKHVNNVEDMLPPGAEVEVEAFDSLRLRDSRLAEQFRKEQRFRIRVMRILLPGEAEG
jgi:hypothetical protein